MNRRCLSLRRQRYYVLRGRRNALERIILGFRPMVAASLIPRRPRPGGPIAHYLSIHTPNNSRHLYVRKSELERFRSRTEAYRKCIHAIAEWVQVNKAMERELRAIRKLRCEKVDISRRKAR